MSVRQLLQHHSSGIVDSTRSVITDNQAFAAKWAQVFRNFGEVPPVPAIDFTKEMVIVASMGTRNSGGYTITVDSARLGGAGLEVYVRSLSPGSTCGVTAALTQPVVLVAVPRASGVARFVEAAARHEC